MRVCLRTATALVFVWSAATASAQVSTGTIAGVVRDGSDAVVANADVIVTSQQTGIQQQLTTSADGRYVAPFLPPGEYTIRARHEPLISTTMSALVRSGMTATVDLTVTLDAVTETVTVTAAAPAYGNHHQVTGWVNREQIASLPLNGRNVLEAVKVEPGMIAPSRISGNRVFIATLGTGLNTIPRIGFTRVTVDGANIETPGGAGSILQVSPEVVDLVQVTTAGFDASVGLATSGAVDVITRSGANQFRVDAFSLYRDRRWASTPAAPGSGADPSFRRHQAGATISGPLVADRAFVLFSYERHDQRDVLAVMPSDPALRPLAGTFASPYSASLFNARIDAQLGARQRLAVRHVHDMNRAFGPDGFTTLPSGWSDRPVRAHLTLGTLTSQLGSTLVNDLRVSYYATSVRFEPASSEDCHAVCVGMGAPRIVVSDGALGVLSVGSSPLSSNSGRRLQASDTLAWQSGAHLARVGLDWELNEQIVANDSDPATLTVWSPEAARQRNPSLDVPDTITSVDDLLQLPLRSFTTSVGSGEVMQRGFQPVRRFHTVRAHVSDQWHIGSHLTLNLGAAWSIESGVLNDDLTKPEWLAPLVDGKPLSVPTTYANLSGSLGLAWIPPGAERTIVRAGIGRYPESVARSASQHVANERVLLSPLGTGRQVVSGSNITWEGQRLNFPQPTTFTAADLLDVLPAIRSSLSETLDPDNRDFSLVNLDLTKEGRNLYDPAYQTPYAVHAIVGVDHELRQGVRLGADFVWKRFEHSFISGIDYNRFNSETHGPLIPACTSAQRTDVLVTCTNGSLYFDTTMGRARYTGLLLRLETRFAQRGRLLASYAFSSYVGTNGTGTGTTEAPDGRVFGFNNDNYFENYGPLPTDFRHILNVSGTVPGPWKMDVSFNVAAYGRAPFTAYIAGMDFNGDGTINDLLPGTRVNQFNRGLNRNDLIRLVTDYNAQYAGTLTPGGQIAPFLTLPETFTFNDNFFALDVRVGRTFRPGGSTRFTAFLDVFNVLNTENLMGSSGNLASPHAFGQPRGRVGGAFGSGSPRAAQVGVRIGL